MELTLNETVSIVEISESNGGKYIQQRISSDKVYSAAISQGVFKGHIYIDEYIV